MTASEIAWWNPTWKRLTLMAIFTIIALLGAIWNDLFVVAWCCCAMGYYWHQMMTVWPPAPTTKAPAGPASSMLDP